MTFSDVVKREHINPEYRDIKVMQMFYQEGYMQGASKYKTKLDEVRTIIQDLLSNSDEYARQRAMDWLKEE